MAKSKSDNNVNGTRPEHVAGKSLRMMGNQVPELTDMSELELTRNALYSRRAFLQTFMDPRRDIQAECGHRAPGDTTAPEFKNLFLGDPIAQRVCSVYPMEAFKQAPTIYEEEDAEEQTAFELRLDEVDKLLAGSQFFVDKNQTGGYINATLREAAIRAGIGRFGIILLGLKDGKKLVEPADGISEDGEIVPGEGKQIDLMYLRVFDESEVKVLETQRNEASPRFGQPTKYRITLADPRDILGSETITTQAVEVHWSRVIHVVLNGTSPIIGESEMEVVVNRLLDLQKLYGGSAEMYWQGAFPGLSFETNPNLGDVALPQQAIKDQTDAYYNNLSRYFAVEGIQVKSLAPQVVDPTPQIDGQIQAICIVKAVPKRVFMGSEMGELASSQDKDTWNDRLTDFRNSVLLPRLCVPFYTRLVAVRVLPQPKQFTIWWEEIEKLNAETKAKIAQTVTAALAQYVSGNVEALIPALPYLTMILGFTDDEAQSIIDAAFEQASDPESRVTPDQNQIEQDRLDSQMEADAQAAQQQAAQQRGTPTKLPA